MNKGYAKKLGCLFFSPFSTSLISGCEHFLNTQTQEPTCPGEEKKAPIQIPGNLGEGDWAGRALPGPLLAVWIWTLKGGMKVGEPATPPPSRKAVCGEWMEDYKPKSAPCSLTFRRIAIMRFKPNVKNELFTLDLHPPLPPPSISGRARPHPAAPDGARARGPHRRGLSPTSCARKRGNHKTFQAQDASLF